MEDVGENKSNIRGNEKSRRFLFLIECGFLFSCATIFVTGDKEKKERK